MDSETAIWIVASGGATGIGGLAILALRRPSDRVLDALLGFTGHAGSARPRSFR